jgi:hypothetical protein
MFSCATLFAFGQDNTVVRSTNDASNWSIVDGPIESWLVSTSAVSTTAANIYVGDDSTDSGYSAQLANLTTAYRRSPPPRTCQLSGPARWRAISRNEMTSLWTNA